ncbi:MAG: PD-(D/E)XK nuclease family protein [Fusobacterium perfoetens]|uniref:PDDEXK-like family protein n=1 Tax=Fusobacterium perfoetens TaxID=852 RepID=UPI0023F4BE6A|nr:PD-(D/E)XK nuclease family protein [Fusobacterium perfoetens]MCI6151964.1 PD-(D/E)XK nuclease family protein [Fusobacterium perfoetens]MDY3237877.1 PD-(D/E)XK nuclease family protein [Fusobacterium perfoetens]
MEEYKIFFEKVSLINEKYKLINSQKEDFNIFSILRDEWDEVNLHSRFISELFRNKNYGKKFIEIFLEKIEVEIQDIENIEIFTEYSVAQNGRIDILIKFIDKNKDKKVLIVENKIYAGDQEEQLKRYYNAMKKEGYKNKEIEIIYLTLNGDEPSEASTKGLSDEIKNKIKIISYKNEIIDWIEDCIKEVALVPVIRETLVQYENLLKKLTGKGEKNLRNELKELVLSNEKYVEAVYSLSDILTDIKEELQLKFWIKLEEKLTEALKKYNINLDKEFNKSEFEKYIKNYYEKTRDNKYYGLMYYIKDIEGIGKLYLKIEIDWNIYYGFGVIIKEKSGSFKKIEIDLEEELFNLNFKIKNTQWLGWKYLYNIENINETINFRVFDRELIFQLNDDKRLEKMIDYIIEQITKTLDVLKDKF